jgi:UDP-glucose 4-epimerase
VPSTAGAESGSTSPAGPRRALVSGGAGFIGSHLADILLARGDAVTIIDNLSTGRRENLPGPHPRMRFIEADLDDALSALGRGERFDEVYHLAAAVGVRLVIADPIGSIETNIDQASALLRFAVEHGPGGAPAPTLIASSSEVYGKSANVPFREDDDVVYGPTTVARWSYAQTKAIDEYLALAYHAQRGLPAVIARFFNTVGPRQVGEYGMVLPRFVAAALAGEDLEVHGDGTQSRCFCDVRDVAAVLPKMLGSAACRGRVFNLGSDHSVTIRELAEMVVRVTGSSSRIRTVPYAQAYARGFEDLLVRRPDVSRLKEAVGFSPRVPLEQTIRDVASWMRAGGGKAGGDGSGS